MNENSPYRKTLIRFIHLTHPTPWNKTNDAINKTSLFSFSKFLKTFIYTETQAHSHIRENKTTQHFDSSSLQSSIRAWEDAASFSRQLLAPKNTPAKIYTSHFSFRPPGVLSNFIFSFVFVIFNLYESRYMAVMRSSHC